MKGFTPEIDKLMWTIAESRDDRSAAEFQEKFPDLTGELEKRMTMVRGLKGAKASAITLSIPQFQPRNLPHPIFSRPGFAAAGAFGLAALGIASYWVTASIINKPIEPAPVRTTPSYENPIRKYTGNSDDDKPVVIAPKPAPQGEAMTEKAPPLPRDEPLITVAFRAATLRQAIELIAAKSNLEAWIDPKMPEIDIDDAEYAGVTGMQALTDLGAKYGFKAFGQGGRDVIIVSTIEAWEPNTDITGTQEGAESTSKGQLPAVEPGSGG